MELGDDAKYRVIGMVSILFCMLVGNVLELHEVLCVLGLTKILLSISCLTSAWSSLMLDKGSLENAV